MNGANVTGRVHRTQHQELQSDI